MTIKLDESKYLEEQGFIYFVGLRRAFKVGWARDVSKRMKQLQTSSPHKLTLIYSLPGTRREEAMLHSFFVAHRLRGEWFKRHHDMDNCISWLRECGSVSSLKSHIQAQLEKIESEQGKYSDMIPRLQNDGR